MGRFTFRGARERALFLLKVVKKYTHSTEFSSLRGACALFQTSDAAQQERRGAFSHSLSRSSLLAPRNTCDSRSVPLFRGQNKVAYEKIFQYQVKLFFRVSGRVTVRYFSRAHFLCLYPRILNKARHAIFSLRNTPVR